MRSLAVLALAGGCWSYKADSFRYPGHRFPGQRVTIDCLDLAIERRVDMVIDGNDAAILGYQFGNRCDEPTIVDLVRVPVIGRTVDGDEVTLTPFDPEMQMMALRLDAGSAGGEAIAYPTTEPLAQVCADASAIGGAPRGKWLCFSATPKVLREAAAPRPRDPYAEDGESMTDAGSEEVTP